MTKEEEKKKQEKSVQQPQTAESETAGAQAPGGGTETPQEPGAENITTKDKTQPAETSPADNVPAPTAKERYVERYRKAHPDMKDDDEEDLYGRANSNLDELEGYRSSNKALSDAFEKNPTLAAMLIAAKDGENPFVWLGENLGMDIKELSDDPEFGKKLSDALIAYQKKQGEGKKADADREKNFNASIEALKKLQNESGMSDDETQELYMKFFEDVAEPASRGIVTDETWRMMKKACDYDTDIEAAKKTAQTRGINQHIDNNLRKKSPDVPPTLSTGTRSAEPKKKGGFFEGIQ